MIWNNLKRTGNDRALLCGDVVTWSLEASFVAETVHGVPFHFKQISLADCGRWAEVEARAVKF